MMLHPSSRGTKFSEESFEGGSRGYEYKNLLAPAYQFPDWMREVEAWNRQIPKVINYLLTL